MHAKGLFAKPNSVPDPEPRGKSSCMQAGGGAWSFLQTCCLLCSRTACPSSLLCSIYHSISNIARKERGHSSERPDPGDPSIHAQASRLPHEHGLGRGKQTWTLSVSVNTTRQNDTARSSGALGQDYGAVFDNHFMEERDTDFLRLLESGALSGATME